MSRQLVLVTGGSGFLGSWCIIELLKAGYRVRTTVRSLKREADVRAMLKAGGAQAGERAALLTLHGFAIVRGLTDLGIAAEQQRGAAWLRCLP